MIQIRSQSIWEHLRINNLLSASLSSLIFGFGLAVTAQVQAKIILEEVVITATKRTQNAQDVGKSVNAFDSQALDKAGIEDVSRLELITPGLAFAQRGNDYKISIRGADAENTDRAEPVPNGVFVDGLYRLRAAQGGNAFLDVASVEVLKGPQGTLFGRNTLGGAILVKTNKPDTEAPIAGAINFTVGNFEKRKAQGFVNAAIKDNFAVRLAGSWNDADGWIKNLGASNDLGEVDDVAIRGSALWEPSENLSILVSHFHYDSGGSALGAYGYQSRGTLRDPDPTSVIPITQRQTVANGIHDPVNSRGGSLGTRGDRGPWEIYRDSDFIRDVQEDTTALEINWYVGDISIKSLSAYTDYFNLAQVDGDYSEGRLLEESRLDDTEYWSTELQISGETEKLDWVTGLYYSQEDMTHAFLRTWLGFAATAAEVAANTPIAALANCGNAFGSIATAAVADPTNPNAVCPNQFAGNPSELENETFGVFAHGIYRVTDSARVSAGVRYSRNKMDYFGQRIMRSTGVLGQTTIGAPSASSNESWSKVTWEVGGELDVFEDSLLYASVSTGFLAGSYNNNGTTYDPQKVIAYEIGLKNRLLNDRLELNIAAYRNEFDDMLAGILDAQSLTVKTNGGSLTAMGIEVDLKALVTDNFTMVANMAYMDSSYDTFGASNRFQSAGTLPLDANGNISLDGRDTPWAPTASGNVGLSYSLSTAMGVFTPHMQLAYSGSHFTTGLQQFDLAKQDAYAKLDMRLYWESHDGHWNAQAYVENVSNIAVLQHTIVGGSDIIQVSWGKPRMYGFRVGYNF